MERLQLRSEYEENIRECCKDGKEDMSSLMKIVKNSFNEALLDTLCEVRWGVEKCDTTDEFYWRRSTR